MTDVLDRHWIRDVSVFGWACSTACVVGGVAFLLAGSLADVGLALLCFATAALMLRDDAAGERLARLATDDVDD